jgi:UDP-N-acetylmuramoylalanine--D-glutamate ligase
MTLPRVALVLGLARSGHAAALALARRGVRVIGTDRRADAGRGVLEAAGVEIVAASDAERVLDDVELLVKSPGVPAEAPLVLAVRARSVPVWSELELGYRLLDGVALIGVTGTNGKTTTSELLGAMLEVPVAGNVGRALCELDGVVDGGWVVCEVSSFQLEDVHEFRPRVGVLLNLQPDHLDRHGTFDAYRAAKLRLFERQGADDVAVLPRGFDDVPGDARRIEFSGDDPLPAVPLIPGAHNLENAAAATAAARAAGAGDATIAEALRTFPGVPHRLEPVAERDGVLWVNDSKATNVAAALRALAAYERPLLLIAGGRSKGESFAPLAQAAKGVRRAYLVGEAADELGFVLGDVPHEPVADLEHAVTAAARDAEAGDVVLLSPACASYDQYDDFEQRGDHFRRLVQRLLASGA